MIVHICTAKQEYVTELEDRNGSLAFLLDGPIEIDPRKTCELYRVMRTGKDGKIQQGVELIPMENPRTDDLSRLAFDGNLLIRTVSLIKLNQAGPFAQAYYRHMGNSIIPASQMPPGIKDKNKYRPLKVN